jgi:pimeloyl-ACP methyl ester carboxylesterase
MTKGTLHKAISKDGTEIGYWTSGHGPPLVLVHGGLGDHTRWDALRPHLEPHRTVHAVDRRGRGESGDHPEYALAREFEDVAAVIDAVAKASDSLVDVYAHSAGGIYTAGAAPLTSNIRRLAIYEGWDWTHPEAYVPPRDVLEQMDALVAEGHRESACEMLFREVLEVSDEELAGIRAQPSWSGRVAIVHTVTREVLSFLESGFDPERSGSIRVPLLLLVGAKSPEIWKSDAEVLAAALPDARIAVLDAQGHSADMLAPELVAEELLAFLRERA